MLLHPVRKRQAINGGQQERKHGSNPHIELHPVELHELAGSAGDPHFFKSKKLHLS
jgi:hypothetical protein